MCDPCDQFCCPPVCSPYCDPCCPPMSCAPVCCPSPCDPCCPSPCDPCCPSPCDPCCPPMCGPCPPKCSPCPPKRCKSRELRSSILMTNCECVKRNGLQLDCPRTDCKGRPCCTVKPWPACCPSKYSWRYTNVTMGKPTNPARPACKPKNDGLCNPCVAMDCCDPCYTGC